MLVGSSTVLRTSIVSNLYLLPIKIAIVFFEKGALYEFFPLIGLLDSPNKVVATADLAT